MFDLYDAAFGKLAPRRGDPGHGRRRPSRGVLPTRLVPTIPADRDARLPASAASNGQLAGRCDIDRSPPIANDPQEYRDFLSAVTALGTTDNGVFAAKIHRQQLEQAVHLSDGGSSGRADDMQVRTWFPNPRFVYLRRADTIRRAISHYRAIQTEVWWQNGTDEPSPDGDLTPAPGEIERLRRMSVGHDREWRSLFRRLRVRPLELLYEDVCVDLEGAVRRVLEHIGVDSGAVGQLPAPRLSRQADDWTDRAVHQYITWRRSTGDVLPELYGSNLKW